MPLTGSVRVSWTSVERDCVRNRVLIDLERNKELKEILS